MVITVVQNLKLKTSGLIPAACIHLYWSRIVIIVYVATGCKTNKRLKLYHFFSLVYNGNDL